MNAKELAAKLTGREYRSEITSAEAILAKAAGLVVVFGASDDLVEFRGAIDDEMGAPGIVTVDSQGVLPDFEVLLDDCHGAPDAKERLRKYFKREGGQGIDALWDREEPYSWTFKTDIPHETFEIVEDGEPYCRGIVFALADLTVT